ncbi:vWA domain-containing protein [Coraliomargarita parva]|uniref:vWA domain-containing protein n=1 Tax=Coraliomargarita parva TaxID=3014050 RepID=UPI0022B390A4|nr:vWA domain-containing protein [Coraliomargarita parva]
MNNDLTYIAFILDRSGSMQSMAQEAIGGFNAFIEEQKKEPGDVRLSLVLFDHEYQPTVTDMPIQEMPPLTAEDYQPRGTTALLDAMGRTIDDLGKTLAALPEAERPGGVIVVTLTDGLENASQDYSSAMVAQKVKHQQAKYGWQFLFLGANLEAAEQAEALNIQRADRSVYASVEEGIAFNSKEISRRRREQRTKKIGF